jgi:hypothetical protein
MLVLLWLLSFRVVCIGVRFSNESFMHISWFTVFLGLVIIFMWYGFVSVCIGIIRFSLASDSQVEQSLHFSVNSIGLICLAGCA